MGKRTLVIVDTPCVHQLLEAFVSKLYAQSYSFCSLEVSTVTVTFNFILSSSLLYSKHFNWSISRDKNLH
jgi:hypothetical protein